VVFCNFTEFSLLNISFFNLSVSGSSCLCLLRDVCSLVIMMRRSLCQASEGGLATVFSGGRTSLNVLWVSAFLIVAGWDCGQRDRTCGMHCITNRERRCFPCIVFREDRRIIPVILWEHSARLRRLSPAPGCCYLDRDIYLKSHRGKSVKFLP